jgi:predicted ATP-dependent endonuclease of OLD family
MQISKLKIKNYRSIKNPEEISLNKLFALIGQNNVGKSTILKAIRLVFADDGIEVKKTDFHKDIDEDIEIEATLQDFYSDTYNEFKNVSGLIVIKLVVNYNNLEHQYFLNGNLTTKTKIKKLPELLIISDIRDPESEAKGSTKSFLKKIFFLILQTGETKEIIKSREVLRKSKKSEIADVSKKITEKIQKILSTNDVEVSVSAEVDFSKIFSYTSKFIDHTSLAKHIPDGVDILSCGTGIQSMFILSLLETYAEIAKRDDSILLIEEPEVYLHPTLQRKMFEALREIAGINQVIYTTHSPIMISDLWVDDSIKLVTLENGETSINEIDVEKIINELGIRYEDTLNAKAIVFVEGKDDLKIFERIERFLSKDRNQIKFISTDSFKSMHLFAQMKILFSDNVNAEFYCIADSDGVESVERKQNILDKIEKQLKKIENGEKLDKFKNRINILTKYSIESYFLDPEILHNAFPDIKKEDLKEMIDVYNKKYEEARKETKNLSEFQRIFKPKHIFNNQRIPYKDINETFKDSKVFLETRTEFSKRCDEVDKTNFKLDFILSKNEISNSNFNELRILIEGILNEIKIT